MSPMGISGTGLLFLAAVLYQSYHEPMAQISEPPFGRFGFVHRGLLIKSINSALPALSRRSRLS